MFTLFIILEILAFIGIILIALMVVRTLSEKSEDSPTVRIEHINSKIRKLKNKLIKKMLTKEHGKKAIKDSIKKQEAEEEKANKDKKSEEKEITHGERVFVLDFEGDIHASQVENLREEISTIISIANPGDEVLLRLNSPGGTVNGYGLVASQLQRLSKAKILLTTSVDEMAASGGYLAAVVSNKIIAAPFAYIGSIGVVVEFPNFNKALKKFGVDYQTYTAGNSKRSVGMLAPVTKEGEKRLAEDLKKIHDQFKKHVKQYRKNVDINKIGTGKVWLADEAIKLGMVDTIMTSDEYLCNLMKSNKQVYKVETDAPKPNLMDKLSDAGFNIASRLMDRFLGSNANREKI